MIATKRQQHHQRNRQRHANGLHAKCAPLFGHAAAEISAGDRAQAVDGNHLARGCFGEVEMPGEIQREKRQHHGAGTIDKQDDRQQPDIAGQTTVSSVIASESRANHGSGLGR